MIKTGKGTLRVQPNLGVGQMHGIMTEQIAGLIDDSTGMVTAGYPIFIPPVKTAISHHTSISCW